MEAITELSETTLNRLIGTVILVAIVLVLRALVVRAIRREEGILSDEQRRWISRTRNLSFIALLIGLVLIWATAIHNLALSLTAVAVALVVATKELILCFSGALLRASSGGFRVGDWIEVGGVHGEVVDQTFLTTTLQEIELGQNSYGFTGKTVVIPNSSLLTQAVIHDNFRKRYVYHTFSVTMDPHFNIFDESASFEERLRERCAEFEEIARRYNSVIEKRVSVDFPGPEPSIRVSTTDVARIVVRITISCVSQFFARPRKR